MNEKIPTRPFAKIDSQDFREALPLFGGGALKVWLAYKLRSNRDGIAWPGLAALSKDTGLSHGSISRHRSELIKIGGLTPVGNGSRNHDRGGRWGSPKFRVLIPQMHRTAKMAYGENTARREVSSPYGKNDMHRTAKMAYEVDSEKNIFEEKGAAAPRHFANPKMPDPRFDGLKKIYIAEFEKKSPNLKAPFDASDGKMLKKLLERQSDVTCEDLVVWLKNAFASDDTPPLRPQFRLREFCAHAEKYARGPLKRGGAPVRSALSDNSEASRLGELAQ